MRFNSSDAALDANKTYRIRVLPATGAAELGCANIDVVNNALEALLVNRGKFTPLVRGATLAIRFRIDKVAVDSDGDGVFDWLDNCPTVKNPPVKTSADVPLVDVGARDRAAARVALGAIAGVARAVATPARASTACTATATTHDPVRM